MKEIGAILAIFSTYFFKKFRLRRYFCPKKTKKFAAKVEQNFFLRLRPSLSQFLATPMPKLPDLVFSGNVSKGFS